MSDEKKSGTGTAFAIFTPQQLRVTSVAPGPSIDPSNDSPQIAVDDAWMAAQIANGRNFAPRPRGRLVASLKVRLEPGRESARSAPVQINRNRVRAELKRVK